MTRRTSTRSTDDSTLSEESTPALPILTRSQQRRFIQEQRTVIESLMRDFSPDQQVYYTLYDSPSYVQDDALEEIMGVQMVINEIIFDRRRSLLGRYPKALSHSVRGCEATYQKARQFTTRTAMR